jgi:hypothetical protein
VPLAPAATDANRPVLASIGAIPSQYHALQLSVSDRRNEAVSRGILFDIARLPHTESNLYFKLNRRLDASSDRQLQIAAGQYQQDPDERKRRLMAVVGVAFAGAYVVFLAAWFWATRLRSRPRRH